MLKLKAAQQRAIDFIYNQDASILVAPTGAGKTVICLTAINELIKAGVIKRAGEGSGRGRLEERSRQVA